MQTRRQIIRNAAAIPLVAAGLPAFAGPARVYAENGIAIRGADAVAYFLGEGAVAGSVRESVTWYGAHWLFSTPANREAFERDPRHYAPRFGGYCAYKLSQGRLEPSEPRAYAIHDGELFLMNSLPARTAWARNLLRNVKYAETYWPTLFG